MFLLSYGFPVLFQYFGDGIRYCPRYSSLAQGMFYANIGFLTLWLTYNSTLFYPLLSHLKKFSVFFVKVLRVNKFLIYLFVFLSIVVNLKSIYSGNYGVLSTIYNDDTQIGFLDQIEFFASTALKGVVFLQAWQYFKYNIGKKLFFVSFLLLLFFQILAGYKGSVVMSFIILLIANYLATRRINYKLTLVCIISLIVAYGLVNPYREYLLYTGERPSSITAIVNCVINGVFLQSQIIASEDVSVVEEVMSRFTTLPELAAFIEYKEGMGLRIPRDPDFMFLCYSIPAQLLVPRFIWLNKPVNDLGIWWVSNTVVGNMSNSSTAFGSVGFLYLTFGTIAIVFGFMIVSFMLKICERLMSSNRDGAVLCGIILLSSLYNNEAGFNTYIVEGLRFLFIGILFQAVILKHK